MSRLPSLDYSRLLVLTPDSKSRLQVRTPDSICRLRSPGSIPHVRCQGSILPSPDYSQRQKYWHPLSWGTISQFYFKLRMSELQRCFNSVELQAIQRAIMRKWCYTPITGNCGGITKIVGWQKYWHPSYFQLIEKYFGITRQSGWLHVIICTPRLTKLRKQEFLIKSPI